MFESLELGTILVTRHYNHWNSWIMFENPWFGKSAKCLTNGWGCSFLKDQHHEFQTIGGMRSLLNQKFLKLAGEWRRTTPFGTDACTGLGDNPLGAQWFGGLLMENYEFWVFRHWKATRMYPWLVLLPPFNGCPIYESPLYPIWYADEPERSTKIVSTEDPNYRTVSFFLGQTFGFKCF